jgi:hypothetical protein
MNSPGTGRPESDTTTQMLRVLADGSLAGLANYHLWALQLREIRDLPERSVAERELPDRDTGG